MDIFGLGVNGVLSEQEISFDMLEDFKFAVNSLVSVVLSPAEQLNQGMQMAKM